VHVQQGNIISFILPIAVGRGGSHREAGNEGRRRSAREKVLCLGFGTVLGCFDAVLADRPSVEAGLNIVSKWSSRFALWVSALQ